MADGKVKLNIVDVYGKPLQEPVDIFLRNQSLNLNYSVRQQVATKTIEIPGLERFPNGVHRVEIDAPSYQVVSRFINIGPSDDPDATEITLPVNPLRVVDEQFPAYSTLGTDVQQLLGESNNVLGFIGAGPTLYDALDPIRKAGFLNLVTKAGNTRFVDAPGDPSRTVLSFLGPLTEIRGDRLFAVVPPELKSHCEVGVQQQLFHAVDESLHEPPNGFDHAGSYKTFDHYGNLQLTFFVSSTDQNAWRVDMDIDDAQGVEHIFQVVRNAATGQPTHPYNIHEILLEYQKLDPGYELLVRPAAKAAGA